MTEVTYSPRQSFFLFQPRLSRSVTTCIATDLNFPGRCTLRMRTCRKRIARTRWRVGFEVWARERKKKKEQPLGNRFFRDITSEVLLIIPRRTTQYKLCNRFEFPRADAIALGVLFVTFLYSISLSLARSSQWIRKSSVYGGPVERFLCYFCAGFALWITCTYGSALSPLGPVAPIIIKLCSPILCVNGPSTARL